VTDGTHQITKRSAWNFGSTFRMTIKFDMPNIIILDLRKSGRTTANLCHSDTWRRTETLRKWCSGERLGISEREEETGGWRKLRNEVIRRLYSSQNILWMIKKNKKRWHGRGKLFRTFSLHNKVPWLQSALNFFKSGILIC